LIKFVAYEQPNMTEVRRRVGADASSEDRLVSVVSCS